jgi:hypothetical protein
MDSRQGRTSFERLPGRAVAALVLSLLSLGPSAAWADADAPAPPADVPELRRELAGHNFIPSRYSLDPFNSTYVSSETGFGYGTATGHTFDIHGNPISVADYQVGAYAQFLSFQYGFLDWWSVRATLELVVFSGLNTPGVVAVGTNAFGRGSFGTTMSWKVGDNLRLGGSFDFGIGPSVFFNILNAVQDSIDAGNIVAPVTSTGSYSLEPAFVGAWAIQKWVGLTFSLAYLFNNATSTNSVTGQTNSISLLAANALFDFDLKPACDVPLGFLAGFETEFSANATAFRQYRWQFGMFYTGVKQLNAGAEVVYQRAPVVGATQIFLSSLQVFLVLQYNFN